MKTKIILEMGCNHQGDIKLAKEMILDASKLGVWAVKFQKRDIEAMPENMKNKPRKPETSLGDTYYEHRKKLEFSVQQLTELKNYAQRKGLRFICTAFDVQSLHDVCGMCCDYVKLPSQLFSDEEMYNVYMDKYSSHVPIVLSTGMHNKQEILNSKWLVFGNILMHCVSVYPAKLHQLNMRALLQIANFISPMPGYSSHGINGKDVFYAVLCGAKYVERHYTKSKVMIGNDHETVSSDFDEMLKIIEDIEKAEMILGDGKVILPEDEKKVRLQYRGF